MSLRGYYEITWISLRYHFEFTSISLRFHFDVTSISLRVHFDVTSVSHGEKGKRPATQWKRENSAGQKGKGKGPGQDLSSNSTWQPDRAHARTKRNDFPVGVTPQPPMTSTSMEQVQFGFTLGSLWYHSGLISGNKLRTFAGLPLGSPDMRPWGFRFANF